MDAQKDHFYATVGEAIRAHRQRSNFTVEGLAVAAKITRNSLFQAEDGLSVSLITLARIAHALDVTLDDLVPIAALEKP